MPVTITKTVTFAGDLPDSGSRYDWVGSYDGNGGSNWVSISETSTDVWDFTVEDWSTNPGQTRSVTFELLHHLASEYTSDPDLRQSFTITQYSDSNL